MSQELQTSGQYATLSLWGSSIHCDKKVVQLKEFSAFLEQRAKKIGGRFSDHRSAAKAWMAGRGCRLPGERDAAGMFRGWRIHYCKQHLE